jgi:hypothetical protein
MSIFTGKHILLGVTGSIAAYKAADLASKLAQAGALVDVLLTSGAEKFVTPLTFQSVSGRAPTPTPICGAAKRTSCTLGWRTRPTPSSLRPAPPTRLPNWRMVSPTIC